MVISPESRNYSKLYTQEEVDEKQRKSRLSLVFKPVETPEGTRFEYDGGGTLSASQDAMKQMLIPLNRVILDDFGQIMD